MSFNSSPTGSKFVEVKIDYDRGSPTFPAYLLEPGISPMTDLVHNLCTTSIGLNPRKLSLSSCGSEDSPLAPCLDAMDTSRNLSPLVDPNTRLLKNAFKVSTPVGAARRSVARRLAHDHDRDENLPPSASTAVSSSPNKMLPSPSKFAAVRQLTRMRTPLEDQDPNSQDSGISSGSFEDSSKSFRFAEPSGFAPRKMSTTDFSSPRRLLAPSNSNSSSSLSQSSIESIDDGFTDLLHDKMLEDENAQLPSGMNSLLMQPILRHEDACDAENLMACNDNSPFSIRPMTNFRRCFSENTRNQNVVVEEFSLKMMKRPAAKTPISPHAKRHKALKENTNVAEPQKKPAQRTLFDHGFKKQTLSPRGFFKEASDAKINSALLRSSEEELIGDFSRPFALPLMKGNHQDLKCISCDTLANLIQGEYKDDIATYQIIDCRYPYEYEGGHIKGAKNIYTKDQLEKEFMETKPKWDLSSGKRNVVIFHCEFSSERGPSLSRFLRQRDRDSNSDSYPALVYPELYLLNGGYKAFYQSHMELCVPCAYLKMTDPKHENDLKLFRAKAKSWSGDRKHRLKRPSFLRLQ